MPSGFVSFKELANDPSALPDDSTFNRARVELAKERMVTGIAKLRLERGMSQRELASAIGTSQPRLSTWEKGTQKPSFENLKLLHRVLDVSYDELMGAVDD